MENIRYGKQYNFPTKVHKHKLVKPDTGTIILTGINPLWTLMILQMNVLLHWKKIVKFLITCSGVSGSMTSFQARLYSPLVRVQGRAILSARACDQNISMKKDPHQILGSCLHKFPFTKNSSCHHCSIITVLWEFWHFKDWEKYLC